MIVQALENGQKVLCEMGEATKGKIDEVFAKVFDNYLKGNPNSPKPVISRESAEKSIKLINYFIRHKKLLAGYTDAMDVKPSALNTALVKKILLGPGTIIKCQEVARGTRFVSEMIKGHMHELSALGLGLVNTDKPAGGGRASVVFQKVETANLDMEATIQITESLNTFGIKLEEFEAGYQDTENVLCQSKKPKLNM